MGVPSLNDLAVDGTLNTINQSSELPRLAMIILTLHERWETLKDINTKRGCVSRRDVLICLIIF